jgi:hypothetical protein
MMMETSCSKVGGAAISEATFFGLENTTYSNTERSKNTNKPASVITRVNSSIRTLCVLIFENSLFIAFGDDKNMPCHRSGRYETVIEKDYCSIIMQGWRESSRKCGKERINS